MVDGAEEMGSSNTITHLPPCDFPLQYLFLSHWQFKDRVSNWFCLLEVFNLNFTLFNFLCSIFTFPFLLSRNYGCVFDAAPLRELGYRKMKAYVQSASAAGVVEVGPPRPSPHQRNDGMPFARRGADALAQPHFDRNRESTLSSDFHHD